MLEAFKDRWNSVQQDVSHGIQKLKQRKSPSVHGRLNLAASIPGEGPSTSFDGGLGSNGLSQSASTSLNLDAGAELLNKNQATWYETRRFSELNVKAADSASRELGKLGAKCHHGATGLMYLKKEVGTLGVLAEDLSDLVAQTAKLQGLCEEVDMAMSYLEVICDTQEFQEKRLDANFNFSLYRERKIAEFNDAKAEMAIKYMQDLENKEQKRAVEQNEKQQLYQRAFETDLQLYKTTGLVANTLPPLEISAECGGKSRLLVKSEVMHHKSQLIENTNQAIVDSSSSGDPRASSATALLRNLVQLSHERNKVLGRVSDSSKLLQTDENRGKSEEDSTTGFGSIYVPNLENSAVKELADLLAGSQLHAHHFDFGFPAKKLRSSDGEKGANSTEDGSECGGEEERVFGPQSSTVAARGEQGCLEGENFSAGDQALLEEFLSDVKLEDSGIAGSESQSVNGDSDPQ